MKRIVSVVSTFLILSSIFIVPSAVAQDDIPDFTEVLSSIDRISNLDTDISLTMAMDIKDPEEGDRTRKVQQFRRDTEDMFLMLIQEPESRLGQGNLRVDDSIWQYDPESRQFTYRSLAESFEGSSARNSDFRRSSRAQNYDVVSHTEGKLGNFDVWIVELEAKHEEVTFPFKTITITKDTLLILKTEDFGLSKRLLRTSYFPSYTKIEDKFIANKMIFVDALVEGKSTTVTYDNISAADIPDTVFSKAYIERVNR